MRLSNKWLHYGLLSIIYGVAFVTLATHTVLHAHKPASSCTSTPVTVEATVSNRFTPSNLEVTRCTVVTITNNGTRARQFAFGQHQGHLSYPGYTERLVKSGDSIQITLGTTGSFTLHDHLQETVSLEITVR